MANFLLPVPPDLSLLNPWPTLHGQLSSSNPHKNKIDVAALSPPILGLQVGMAEAGQPSVPGGSHGVGGGTPLSGAAGQTGARSFVSVTKAAPVNRFPTIQLAPRKYGTKDGKPSVSFSPAELQAGVYNLKHALVAKFSTGRPPIEEIRQAFMAAWGLAGKCSIGALDSRHILIVLDSEQEARKVLAHPTRKLGHAFFRVFRWTKDFDSKKESSVTTTWIRLLNLPPGMFNQGYIESIVSSFSRFLAVDIKTATLSNPCYARVCVELDTSRSLPDAVWINTGGDGGFWQKVIYENRLSYCTKCKLHGHDLSSCRKHKKRHEEQLIWAARDDHGLPIAKTDQPASQGLHQKVKSLPIETQTKAGEGQETEWRTVQNRKRNKTLQQKHTQLGADCTAKADKTAMDCAETTSQAATVSQIKETSVSVMENELAKVTGPQAYPLQQKHHAPPNSNDIEPSEKATESADKSASVAANNAHDKSASVAIAGSMSTMKNRAGEWTLVQNRKGNNIQKSTSQSSPEMDIQLCTKPLNANAKDNMAITCQPNTLGLESIQDVPVEVFETSTDVHVKAINIDSAKNVLPCLTYLRRTKDLEARNKAKISTPVASHKNRSISKSKQQDGLSPIFLLPV